MLNPVVKFLTNRTTKNMYKILFVVSLCVSAIACGGSSLPRLPQDGSSDPASSPTPTPVSITIKASDILNMGMIGETWTFQNGNGAINTFEIQAVPANAGCRDGNNLAIHMTKTVTNTYWQMGAPAAEVFTLLHQNPDGSWRATANLINMPQGSLFSGPMVVTSDIIDNRPEMPLPYMIAPMDTSTGQHFIFETRSSGTGAQGLSYVCNIPDGTPLAGPMDGEYWRTDFYIENVSTPLYSGPAIVSDQFEGVCGHEKWYFAPNLGIVEIKPLNDGGEIKMNPVCVNYTTYQFDNPLYYIKRIS